MSLLATKILYRDNKNEILVPTLTWISDIVAVINNGFKPVFVDIDLKNLSMSEDEIIKKSLKELKRFF